VIDVAEDDERDTGVKPGIWTQPQQYSDDDNVLQMAGLAGNNGNTTTSTPPPNQ
jgi:hypothetical protein